MTKLLPAHDGITVTTLTPKPDAIHPTASDLLMNRYLPILGPSSIVSLHILSRHAANGDTAWMMDELAATFGISPSVMRSTLERLISFGMIAPTATGIAVPTMIPDIPRTWLPRLPEYLR
jgi:hypothetical protein